MDGSFSSRPTAGAQADIRIGSDVDRARVCPERGSPLATKRFTCDTLEFAGVAQIPTSWPPRENRCVTVEDVLSRLPCSVNGMPVGICLE
jgi:hypothetical protein